MRTKARWISFFIVSVALSACDTIVERHDDDEDIQECVRFVTKYYTHLIEMQWDSAIAMVGGTISHEEGLRLFEELKDAHGRIINARIDVVETNSRTTNSIPQTRFYKSETIVEYEGAYCNEYLGIESKGNAPLRIVSYHSRMDSLRSDTTDMKRTRERSTINDLRNPFFREVYAERSMYLSR